MLKVVTLNKLTLGALYVSIAMAILIAVILVVPEKESRVLLGGQEIRVTIADTPLLQEKGLGGRKRLDEGEGMLFVFESPTRAGFWMKDMSFPIDILWVDERRQIVDVWENAQPESYPEVRAPKADSKYVLEVRAGFFKDHTLKLGDVLELESSAGYTK
ncbi:MAG: DUF192 domain-containing protein [Candidatus Pacebacteria bacterium]|jgi:hypothetical protein|nr:DUF192 domain-containing protein [Candidatus Paceibacterota bacterium]